MKLSAQHPIFESKSHIRRSLRKGGVTAGVILLGMALSECGGGASEPGGNGGSAGSVGSGGSGNQGGGGTGSTTASGGASNTGGGGGTTNMGGTTGTGGSTGTGGAAGTGGSAGTSSAGTGGTVRDGGTVDVGVAPPPVDAGGPTRAVPGAPEYWIAPTGNDANPGTQALPFFSATKAVTLVRTGMPSTIWVLPGTYPYAVTVQLTTPGTPAAPFNIKAVAGARPIFNFALQPRNTSNLRGIDINGDWWHITGIEVENAADNCINIGGSNNTIENVIVHQCGDTGIQITVDGNLAGDPTKGANNTILNCDSWGNLDVATGGENADGFAAKLAIGAGNVFRGCRAWNNADDGWDFFAANDIVTIDSSWSFSNGKTLAGGNNPAGDGNGFKLGGAQSGTDLGGAVHVVRNSFAFENLACGFTRNNNSRVPSLTNSGSARNGGNPYCPGTADFTMTGANNAFTMTAAQAMTAPRNADGSLPAIR